LPGAAKSMDNHIRKVQNSTVLRPSGNRRVSVAFGM